jgi:hypothetical protein
VIEKIEAILCLYPTELGWLCKQFTQSEAERGLWKLGIDKLGILSLPKMPGVIVTGCSFERGQHR